MILYILKHTNQPQTAINDLIESASEKLNLRNLSMKSMIL